MLFSTPFASRRTGSLVFGCLLAFGCLIGALWRLPRDVLQQERRLARSPCNDASTLYEWGSAEQQAKYNPRILEGEIWCQGF